MIRTLPPRAGLLRPQRGEQVGPRLLGPVGARLDHAAGGHRSDADVGPHHQQLVIALRRRELDVGILAGLDAAREQQRDAKQRDTQPAHTTLSPNA